MSQSNIDHSAKPRIDIKEINIPVEGIINELQKIGVDIKKASELKERKPPIIVHEKMEPINLTVEPAVNDVKIVNNIELKPLYFCSIPIGVYVAWLFIRDLLDLFYFQP